MKSNCIEMTFVILGPGGRLSPPPPPHTVCRPPVNAPFSLNVSFLKEITKNVHENQYTIRVR